MDGLSRQLLQVWDGEDENCTVRLLPSLSSDGGIGLLDNPKDVCQHEALTENTSEASAEAKDDYREKSSLSLSEADRIQNDDILHASPPCSSRRSTSDKTQLHSSAENGDTKFVDLLLKAGANVDAKDKNKQTPLHLNAEKGRAQIVEILLKAGANVDAKDKNKQTPLHLSASNGHKDIVEILLQAGANVDAKAKNKQTPLHLSAGNGHKEIVEILLQAGATVDAENKYKETPLHLSFKNNHKDVADILIRTGASDKNRDVNRYSVQDSTSRKERAKYRMAPSTILPSINKLVHSVTTNVKSVLSPASISRETELRETVSATFNPFESKLILFEDSTSDDAVPPTDPTPSCAPPEKVESDDSDDSGDLDVMTIRQQLMDHFSKFCIEESEEGFSPELKAALLAGRIVMPITINITTITKEIEVYEFELGSELNLSQLGVLTVDSQGDEGWFATDDEKDGSSSKGGMDNKANGK